MAKHESPWYRSKSCLGTLWVEESIDSRKSRQRRMNEFSLESFLGCRWLQTAKSDWSHQMVTAAMKLKDAWSLEEKL